MFPGDCAAMVTLFSCLHFQVKQRADECILALEKLTEINSGIEVQNVLPTQFDWASLKVPAEE